MTKKFFSIKHLVSERNYCLLSFFCELLVIPYSHSRKKLWFRVLVLLSPRLSNIRFRAPRNNFFYFANFGQIYRKTCICFSSASLINRCGVKHCWVEKNGNWSWDEIFQMIYLYIPSFWPFGCWYVLRVSWAGPLNVQLSKWPTNHALCTTNVRMAAWVDKRPSSHRNCIAFHWSI